MKLDIYVVVLYIHKISLTIDTFTSIEEASQEYLKYTDDLVNILGSSVPFNDCYISEYSKSIHYDDGSFLVLK